jgi:type I restriction enzyme, R subunit
MHEGYTAASQPLEWPSLTVDWTARESVQAKLRLMVKRILRKYKYPPDQQEAAVELVLQQAKALGEAWI